MVETPASRGMEFATTCWSVVLEARGHDDSVAREAMSELARAYWSPLYAFARRRGHDTDEARDLVQGFFTRLIETDGLRGAQRERGRFRSYLLGAFKHFLSHERERAHAAKRGGGEAPLSLDFTETESQYENLAIDERTPERIFERRWVLTLLDRTLMRLRREWAAAGRVEAFGELKGYLTGDATPQRETARRLGMTDGAVRVAVHRLRQRFGKLLRQEVAATVGSSAEVEGELRYLLTVLHGE